MRDLVGRLLADIDVLCLCHRCRCLSCSNGYENHSHACTGGPDCVETPERQRARVMAMKIALGRARLMLREGAGAIKLEDDDDVP